MRVFRELGGGIKELLLIFLGSSIPWAGISRSVSQVRVIVNVSNIESVECDADFIGKLKTAWLYDRVKAGLCRINSRLRQRWGERNERSPTKWASKFGR